MINLIFKQTIRMALISFGISILVWGLYTLATKPQTWQEKLDQINVIESSWYASLGMNQGHLFLITWVILFICLFYSDFQNFNMKGDKSEK